jgi:hypothetical protein
MTEAVATVIIGSGVSVSGVFAYALKRIRLERILQTEAVERDWTKHQRLNQLQHKPKHAANNKPKPSSSSVAALSTAKAEGEGWSEVEMAVESETEDVDTAHAETAETTEAEAEAEAEEEGEEEEEAEPTASQLLYDALPKWSIDGIACFLAIVMRRTISNTQLTATTTTTTTTITSSSSEFKSADYSVSKAQSQLSGAQLFLQTVPFMVALLSAQHQPSAMTVGRQLADDCLALRAVAPLSLSHALHHHNHNPASASVSASASTSAPSTSAASVTSSVSMQSGSGYVPPPITVGEVKDLNNDVLGLIQALSAFMVFHPGLWHCNAMQRKGFWVWALGLGLEK